MSLFQKYKYLILINIFLKNLLNLVYYHYNKDTNLKLKLILILLIHHLKMFSLSLKIIEFLLLKICVNLKFFKINIHLEIITCYFFSFT